MGKQLYVRVFVMDLQLLPSEETLKEATGEHDDGDCGDDGPVRLHEVHGLLRLVGRDGDDDADADAKEE